MRRLCHCPRLFFQNNWKYYCCKKSAIGILHSFSYINSLFSILLSRFQYVPFHAQVWYALRKTRHEKVRTTLYDFFTTRDHRFVNEPIREGNFSIVLSCLLSFVDSFMITDFNAIAHGKKFANKTCQKPSILWFDCKM